MDWRREDTRYAAAVAAAAALVGYLVAANFGLLPSPFVADAAPRPPAVALAPPPASLPPTPPPAGGGVAVLLPPTGTSGPRPTTAPITDRTPPTSRFTTEGGQLSLGLTSEGAPITGVSTDTRSGVSRVLVTFQRTVTDATTTEASLDCTEDRRRCTWRVDPPAVAGQYTVRVRAIDAAGNAERTGPAPITITIVTTTTDPEESPAPGIVDGLVGTVRGLLGL